MFEIYYCIINYVIISIILLFQNIDNYLIVLGHAFVFANYTCVEMSFYRWLLWVIENWEEVGLDNFEWPWLLLDSIEEKKNWP